MFRIAKVTIFFVGLFCLASCVEHIKVRVSDDLWFRGHSAPSMGNVIPVSEGGSIAQALEQAVPGDTIQLAPGIFREAVVITKGGAEGAPITMRGALSEAGEKLSSITTGVVLDSAGWTPVPEVGPGVYRYDKPLGFKVKSVAANGKQIAPIHDVTGGAARNLTAWNVLAWPDNHRVTDGYVSRYTDDGVLFWEVLKAIYFLADDENVEGGQIIYVRFLGGISPKEFTMEAYPEGSAVTIHNAGHLAIVDCEITGGMSGVTIRGEGAQFNEVRNCDVFFGTDRIVLADNASHNVIRECRIQKRFIGLQPGAWAGAESLKDSTAREEVAGKSFIYTFYKYWASSRSISADRSISLDGTSNNLIWRNELDGGLIGVSLQNVSNILVQENRVFRNSSVGTAIRAEATRIQFDRNHFEDNSINFRLHALNSDSKRVVYLTNNRSVLPEGLGNHVFCHVFEKELPIAPEGSPQIFILNNDFLGGNNGLRMPSTPAVEGGFSNFVILNNIFAVAGNAVSGGRDTAVGVFDYNLIVQSNDKSGPDVPWFGINNVVAQDDSKKPAWIDLRSEFRINSRTFGPIPYMDIRK